MLVPLAGCAIADPGFPEQSYETMRDRLGDEATRLLVSTQSSGTVLARRYVHDHWEELEQPLVIESGNLVVAADVLGGLRVEKLGLRFAPIQLPEAVFGRTASLSDAKLMQAVPAQGTPTWDGPNSAQVTLPLDLEVSWRVEVMPGNQPFHASLVAVPVEVTLSGTGDYVSATLGVRVSGVVWSLADLFELSDAALTLEAMTGT
jgi:hypothetical protein